MSLTEKLVKHWEELEKHFDEQNLFEGPRALVKNFNETVIRSVGYPIEEFRRVIGYARKEIYDRFEELRKRMGVKTK
jgi:hypothetical protein